MDIRDEDLRAIARLWHELAETPAARSDEALTHCFTQLARIIGARNVFWVGAARGTEAAGAGDLLRGWRPRAFGHLHRDPARDRIVADIMRQYKANIVDPQTQALVARAGTTRAILRREVVDDETWENSWIVNECMRPIGVEYRLIGAHAIDARMESYIGLDRGAHEQPFGEHLFLLGCPGFHREQLLAHGLAQPRLTARELAVLRLLLTDRSERQIGEALGLTWRTTHQYVVSVLKKFGVKGRVGLMATWLRHRSNGTP
jgi:DNA-binding CsgD family transcriptional regulator